MAFSNWLKQMKTGAKVVGEAGSKWFKGGGSATAQDIVLKGLSGRVKTPAEATSSQLSLKEYLKKQPWYQSKASQNMSTMEKRIEAPITKAIPKAIPKAISDVKSKITSDITSDITPKKATDTLPEKTPVKTPVKKEVTAPQAKTAPQVWKTAGDVITRRGVYSRSKTAQGGSRMIFKRKNQAGDILDGKEIYTHRKEWRPLSSEYKSGKGELLFSKPKMLKKLKERV